MSENTRCQVTPLEKPIDEAALKGAEAVYLHVQGMGCQRCATRVRNGLLGLEGVLAASIFLKEGVAAAAFDPRLVEINDLIIAVAGAGNDGRHVYRAHVLGEAPIESALVASTSNN